MRAEAAYHGLTGGESEESEGGSSGSGSDGEDQQGRAAPGSSSSGGGGSVAGAAGAGSRLAMSRSSFFGRMKKIMRYLFSSEPELWRAADLLLRAQPTAMTEHELIEQLCEQVRGSAAPPRLLLEQGASPPPVPRLARSTALPRVLPSLPSCRT